MQVGLEKHTRKILEGDSNYGDYIANPPFISFCKLHFENTNGYSGPENSDGFGCIFREDLFEPVSRVRRGRIYESGTSQPQKWNIRATGETPYADTYSSKSIQIELNKLRVPRCVVSIGDKDRFTTWKVIGIEVISTGEELITLKAISSMGIMPQLIQSKVNLNTSSISDAVDKVCDAAFRDIPEVIVDICRSAAVAIFSDYLNIIDQDLGQLLKALEDKPKGEKKEIAANAGRIINRLHPRGKLNEAAKYQLRALKDEDANLAVSCISMMLVELEYAQY
jgi:hypothetical protein